MRILYLSQYFPPEAGATQTRAYEMAKNWIRLGHQVTILTEFPNHPSGIIPSKYKGKLYERSTLEGIEVLRVWVKASPVKNFLNRMAFYSSYMLNAIIAGLFLLREQFDFIYASSPPLFVGGAALVLSFIKHIPMVFEVRDLWPESAQALGEITNPIAISISKHLEERCYRKAIQVIVVTKGIYDRLKRRGIPEEKLFLIPNGANTEMYIFKPEERTRIREELGLNDKFILIYAGIFGLAYSLDTIFETAKLLIKEKDIYFLLIGDGPKKADVVSMSYQYKLPNLSVLPEKPREMIPDYLSASDVALIPLRKVDILNLALPVKIFDAWACERPVLVCIEGESREMVENAKGGKVIPPDDPVKMAEAILQFRNSPQEIQMMGKNGRKYIEQNHSRAALAEKLILHLEKYFQK